jgi:hypothetical protein
MRTMLFTIGKDITLTGALAATHVGAAAAFTLTARGGTSPYRIVVDSVDLPVDWSMVETTLGSVWTITDAEGGEWVITSNGDGTVDIETTEAAGPGSFSITFRVKDADRDARLITRTLQVIALPLEVSDGPLAAVTVGTPYSDTLTISGGVPGYSAPLENLPAGLSVNIVGGTATISGTTTGAGLGPGTNFSIPIFIDFEDSDGNTFQYVQTLSVIVPELQLSGSLSIATESVAYSQSLTRTGGIGNITVTASSGLPSALVATADNVNSQVDVTGTPAAGTATGSPYAVSITVEDAEGNIAVLNDSLQVQAVPVVYSAWNPSDKSGSIDLSDSNRRASRNTTTASANAMTRSVTSKNSGKWYVEDLMHYSPNFDCWGVAKSSTPLGPTSGPGIDANSWAVYSDTGQKYHDNILTTYGPTTKTGADGANARRTARAIDLDNGRIKFGVELTAGSGIHWGDGSGGGTTDFDAAPWAFTNLNGDIFIALSLHSSTAGSGTPNGSSRTLYTDPADHLYSPPPGFTAGWPD